MKTSSIDYKEMMEKESRMRFEYMARDFFEKWQPDDPQLAQDFSADLFCLVRQIYVDANEPAMRQLTEVMSCMAPLADLGLTGYKKPCP